jgi:hypothetical protein
LFVGAGLGSALQSWNIVYEVRSYMVTTNGILFGYPFWEAKKKKLHFLKKRYLLET